MASKYFKSRAKSSAKTITPASSSKVFNDPNVDEKYKEVINQFQMSLIKSGEGILNTFNSSTVNSIPESIIRANDSITRLNDRIISQSFAAVLAQVSITKNQYLEKINKIITSLEKVVKISKSNKVALIPYFGKIDQSSGTFFPRIIKYDAQGNPLYDMRVGVINSIGDIPIEVSSSHVP
jgi:phage tail sheath protein FI